MKNEERFWANVQKIETCWLRTGPQFGTSPRGSYGSFYDSVLHKHVMAHRFSYELHDGFIPEGMQLDHLCRVRLCVNPAHLEPVTASENTKRGDLHMRKRTHCPQGHPLEGANVRMIKTGRTCRICHRLSNRKYHRNKRGTHAPRPASYKHDLSEFEGVSNG